MMGIRYVVLLLAALVHANEVELVEDAAPPADAKNATSAPPALPICKGGCSGLSCAYPRMCKQMITQYKCQCKECSNCDGQKPPENVAVGKEHFTRRKVGQRR